MSTAVPADARDARPRADAAGARACVAVAAAAFLAFCGLVALAPGRLVYDEPYYLHTVRQLEELGPNARFLNSLDVPAGPLYAVVHWLAQPLTGLHPPGVRVVNLVLTALTTLLLVRLLGLLRPAVSPVNGADLLCVPAIGASACMALTEIPAMFFAALAMLLLAAALHRPRTGPAARLGLAIGAGACLGAAVLGRQPYLLALAAVPLLAVERRRDAVPVLAAFVAAAAAVCVPVFVTWGGVLPPLAAAVGRGVAPGHGVLAAGYAALVMAVLAPRYLAVPPSWAAAMLLGGGAVNAATGLVRITPLSTLALRLLPPPLAELYTWAASALLVGAGLLFVAATLRNCVAMRREPVFLFCAVAALLIVASCAKNTSQFSSRYVTVAAPLLVVAAAYYSAPTRWKAPRLAAGALVSVLAVVTYLY